MGRNVRFNIHHRPLHWHAWAHVFAVSLILLICIFFNCGENNVNQHVEPKKEWNTPGRLRSSKLVAPRQPPRPQPQRIFGVAMWIVRGHQISNTNLADPRMRECHPASADRQSEVSENYFEPLLEPQLPPTYRLVVDRWNSHRQKMEESHFRLSNFDNTWTFSFVAAAELLIRFIGMRHKLSIKSRILHWLICRLQTLRNCRKNSRSLLRLKSHHHLGTHFRPINWRICGYRTH